MGYPNSEWVGPFTNGKVISRIYQQEKPPQSIVIEFYGGESLAIYYYNRQYIVTPFGSNGEVKQTTEIK